MSSILKLLSNPAPTESPKRLMRDSLVEFVASTIFIFAGTLSAVATGSHLVVKQQGTADVARILPIAMSFGISILALAHSIGHLSGGHMNPGVSLLMFFKGQISVVKMLTYWIAQFAGGLLGAALTWGCTSGLKDVGVDAPPFLLGSTTLSDNIGTGNGFLIEFMGSFFFYFVIAQTALDNRGIATTAFPAIPIGLVLVVVHICLIPFTGCGVNPARTFGPSMVSCIGGSNDECKMAAGDWYWIYYVAPAAAAFCVAEVTNLFAIEVEDNNDEGKKMELKEDEVLVETAKDVEA